MRTHESRIVIAGSLLILTLISGVWLSHSGKPINTMIFTIHKLIALVAVIASAVIAAQLHKNVKLKPVEWGIIIVVGFLFLYLFISGALLSIDQRTTNESLAACHQIISLLAFTLISGVWLSHSGKPITAVVFNVHKLAALATVISISVTLAQAHNGISMGAVEWIAVVVTSFLFLSLFVSGALLRIRRPTTAMLAAHRLTPLLIAIATLATVYLMAHQAL